MRNYARSVFILSLLTVLVVANATDQGKLEPHQFTPVSNIKPSSLTSIDEPLLIQNNTDLIDKALLYGWTGNGTRNSPLLIANQSFELYGNISGPALAIMNTTLHLSMTGCNVTNYSQNTNNSYAIILQNVTNVSFENLNIDDFSLGVSICNSANISLKDIFLNLENTKGLALDVAYSEDVQIEDFLTNHSSNSNLTNVAIRHSSQVILKKMSEGGNQDLTLQSSHSSNITIDEIECQSVVVENSTSFNIISSTFSNSINSSARIESSHDGLVTNNSFRTSQTSLQVINSSNLEISNNTFELTRKDGITIQKSHNTSVLRNIFRKIGDTGINSTDCLNISLGWNLVTSFGPSIWFNSTFASNAYNNTVFSFNSDIIRLLTSSTPISSNNSFRFNNLYGTNQTIPSIIDSSNSTNWLHNYFGKFLAVNESFTINSTTGTIDFSPSQTPNNHTPLFPHPPTIIGHTDLRYEVGTTGNLLVWVVKTSSKSYFEISRNSTLVRSGSILGSDQVEHHVDNLAEGTYIFKLLVIDSFGFCNISISRVLVFHRPKFVEKADDFHYVFNRTGYSFTWTIVDDNPDTFVLYRNDSIIMQGHWLSSVPIVVSVDGLQLGRYNYTILVTDKEGFSTVEQAWLEVVPLPVPPIITLKNAPVDPVVTNHTFILTYMVVDDNPDRVYLYINGSMIKNENWRHGNLTFLIGAGMVGLYNITFLATDRDNLSSTMELWVEVRTAPEEPLITSPADIFYSEGTFGHFIEWVVYDDNPSHYYLERNDTMLEYNSWFSGMIIHHKIDNLPPGLFNYTLVVTDLDKLVTNDTVWVWVGPRISSNSDGESITDEHSSESSKAMGFEDREYQPSILLFGSLFVGGTFLLSLVLYVWKRGHK